MKRLALLASLIILVANSQTASANDRSAIDKAINDCITHNHSINSQNKKVKKMKNCVIEARGVVRASKNRASATWDLARAVRQRIGNAPSIKLFIEALNLKKTEELCIDDDLDVAVKYGLALPKGGDHDALINFSKNIVFQQCWAEYKDDLIELTKAGQGNYWNTNLCPAFKKKKVKLAACS